MSKKLTQNDYISAAEALAVPVATVKAVTEVESNGAGFLPDGRPKVLFERHIMYRRVKFKLGDRKADEFARLYPNLINTSTGGYGSERTEPDRMGRAAELIDRECALESASWGLFQIMGYHSKAMGYPTLQAFVNAMYDSEGAQLDAFVRFVKADPAMHADLRKRDWAGFARRYNGPNYAKNRYDVKLSQAYTRHGGA